jgi:hypothetical protein
MLASGPRAPKRAQLHSQCNDKYIDHEDQSESQQYFYAVLDLLDRLASLCLMEESTPTWLPA